MSHNVNWPVGPAETLAAEENHVYYYLLLLLYEVDEDLREPVEQSVERHKDE